MKRSGNSGAARRRVLQRPVVAAGMVLASVLALAPVGASARPEEGTSGQADSPAPATGSDVERPRTVVTTDMEADDWNSLIRYVLYTNEIETQGLVYSSSTHHYSGDGRGTVGADYEHPETVHPQQSWRWTGFDTIQKIIDAYAESYGNLRRHDPGYPAPAELRQVVKVGNTSFPGEMAQDTPGSDLIKRLLLDDDPRPLYLQAWGGTNTIARALKSIEDEYAGTRDWAAVREKVSRKAMILASGWQDNTYQNYIAPTWPDIQVVEISTAVSTWLGRARPENLVYFGPEWTKKNVLDVGPLGARYFTWLDYRTMPGDPLATQGFGYAAGTDTIPVHWTPPQPQYSFLAEGDTGAFAGLVNTGIQSTNPALGGWGCRSVQVSTSPNLWQGANADIGPSGEPEEHYQCQRWVQAQQHDFASRLKWTVAHDYREANHPPTVRIVGTATITATPGSRVTLRGTGDDPDGDGTDVTWWQYRDEGTYPGPVGISDAHSPTASLQIPQDARPGQRIHVILQVSDRGTPSLTRYARLVIAVQ